MKLTIPEVKSHVIPIRLSPQLFQQTQKIAHKNKAKHSTILRILIEKALETHTSSPIE